MASYLWLWTWQGVLLFLLSTFLFDVLHYLLHRWRLSSSRLLRTFASWHQTHHDFLDDQMNVHPELVMRNIWAHLVPEYISSLLGTVIWIFVFDPVPVLIICVIHTGLFVMRMWTEGLDTHHMATDRISGRRGTWFVRPAFHAMHHVNPDAFYSSFVSLFDVIFGTAIDLRGKRIAVTGATGALGSELARRLERSGAEVVRVGRDLNVDPSGIDILVLAHGSRGDDAWEANYASFVRLGERLIAVSKSRLVPPEIWGVGSEAEILGFDDYAMSKRQFADYASRQWRRSKDVTYRHIVPAAFKSGMGWGPIGAGPVAAVALALIRRGFVYIPVTWSGLAFINWFRYVLSNQRSVSPVPHSS